MNMTSLELSILTELHKYSDGLPVNVICEKFKIKNLAASTRRLLKVKYIRAHKNKGDEKKIFLTKLGKRFLHHHWDCLKSSS